MLKSLLDYARDAERVCPVPDRWNELWEMLPERRRSGRKSEPPLPLILSGWWASSNLEKILRLEAHIRWADQHGALEEVDAFLRGLPESDWHHLKD